MDTQEAKQIRTQYNELDEQFRAAKKSGNFKRASTLKAQRDALEPKLSEALRVIRANG